ncbi:hypothetical protein NC652_021616 [Populus alba x Populus x berolinensis]|nr:hypothetical protein NC652_021616 [Populus alba x Populus x berolinensis]
MMSLARMPEREAVLECFLILSREIRDQEGRRLWVQLVQQVGLLQVVACTMEDTLSVEELQRCSRCSCSLQELHDAKQDRT